MSFYVTLSEPPKRNGGEPNGSLPRCARIVCSQRCQTNCIKLSQDFAKDFSARLRSVEMTQGGTRPYIADCGVLVLPLASKVKLRAPSKDLYSDFVNISIEIPRKARDDKLYHWCHPERAAEKERRRAERIFAPLREDCMQSALPNKLYKTLAGFCQRFLRSLALGRNDTGGHAPIYRRLRRARFTPCKQSKAARAFEGSLF